MLRQIKPTDTQMVIAEFAHLAWVQREEGDKSRHFVCLFGDGLAVPYGSPVHTGTVTATSAGLRVQYRNEDFTLIDMRFYKKEVELIEHCGTCRFMRAKGQVSLCCLNPPTVKDYNAKGFPWPVVYADEDWCGSYEVTK